MKKQYDLLADSSLILMLQLAGGGIFNLALYSMATDNPLPFFILLAGVILQAASLTLFAARLLADGNRENSGFYILYVILLSISLSFTRLSRFVGFSGFDAVKEASVAMGTYSANYWDPSLGNPSLGAGANYHSSLAITILPSILGRGLGIPADLALLFQDFLLMAMLPIAVLAVTKSLTGSARFGALSGVLIATNWFFFGEHLIGKTEAALLLCTVSIYCLCRKEATFRSLGVFLAAGVVMSHYTIGLYLSTIVVVLLAWTLAGARIARLIPGFKNSDIPSFSIWRTLLAVGIVLLWLNLAAPSILPTLYSSGQQAIAGLTSTGGQKRADTSLFLSSPAGLAITLWFDFQNGLLGLGALLTLNRYRKGRITGPLASWTVAGIVLITLPLAWITLPGLSVQVESTRVIEMILPFSVSLLGYLLVRVHASPRILLKWSVLVLLFLLIPMNVMLLNPTEVLYHQPDTLSIEKNIDLDSSYLPTASNQAMASWVNNNLPSNKQVETDSVGLYAFQTDLPFPSSITPFQEDFPPYSYDRYAILSFYFIDDGIWSKATLGLRVFVIEYGVGASPFFQPTRSIVYASPSFWVATPPQ